jgi:30S ribosomal protein S31
MGKGDIKSRRGKIRNGSYGVRRRRKKTKEAPPVVVKATKKKTKK